MTQPEILHFCKRHLRCAVELVWVDSGHDWQWFRIERVDHGQIALTGMTDPENNTHDGGFFWATPAEIKTIKLRES